MNRQWRRTIVCVAGTCWLSACAGWRVQEVNPEKLISERHPERVRVETEDGRKIVLSRPEVREDSLRGWSTAREYVRDVGMALPAPPRYTDVVSQVSIALTDVEKVSVRGTNPGTTAVVAVVGGLIVVGVSAFLIALSQF